MEHLIDATGWPLREGYRVRVQPRAAKARSYTAKVLSFESDAKGPIVVVRAEKNWATHFTRTEQCKVIKPKKPVKGDW